MGQGMTQIPWVADGLLLGTAADGSAGLAVGSPAWFARLADDATPVLLVPVTGLVNDRAALPAPGPAAAALPRLRPPPAR